MTQQANEIMDLERQILERDEKIRVLEMGNALEIERAKNKLLIDTLRGKPEVAEPEEQPKPKKGKSQFVTEES